jgi:hypothetical protein
MPTMLRISSLTCAALSMAISGCAFHAAPFVAYEGSLPLAQTAVFSALDQRAQNFNDTRIRFVNGKETSCAQAGCPYWVRVPPGTQSFQIRYTAHFQWNLHSSGYKYADATIEVKDMKPRHVYVVRYEEHNGNVRMTVEDLGENPNYGISLGLEGANQSFHRVQF